MIRSRRVAEWKADFSSCHGLDLVRFSDPKPDQPRSLVDLSLFSIASHNQFAAPLKEQADEESFQSELFRLPHEAFMVFRVSMFVLSDGELRTRSRPFFMSKREARRRGKKWHPGDLEGSLTLKTNISHGGLPPAKINVKYMRYFIPLINSFWYPMSRGVTRLHYFMLFNWFPDREYIEKIAAVLLEHHHAAEFLYNENETFTILFYGYLSWGLHSPSLHDNVTMFASQCNNILFTSRRQIHLQQGIRWRKAEREEGERYCTCFLPTVIPLLSDKNTNEDRKPTPNIAPYKSCLIDENK